MRGIMCAWMVAGGASLRATLVRCVGVQVRRREVRCSGQALAAKTRSKLRRKTAGVKAANANGSMTRVKLEKSRHEKRRGDGGSSWERTCSTDKQKRERGSGWSTLEKSGRSSQLRSVPESRGACLTHSRTISCAFTTQGNNKTKQTAN
jgi:hypothetical protein